MTLAGAFIGGLYGFITYKRQNKTKDTEEK